MKYFVKTKPTIIVHRCGAGGSMRACHAAGQGSIPGRDKFPEWGFFGVFPHLWDKCQEALGPQGPRISFGHHTHPFIFVFWEWMGAWMVCIVFQACVVSEVAPALSWSLIRGNPPCPSVVKKYVCDSELFPSPDRSWLRKARVAWIR